MFLRLNRNIPFLGSVIGAVAFLTASPASHASITYGVPDTWTRDNSSTTTYAGWDVLEGTGAVLGFGRVLNDTTPDVGGSLGIGHTGISYSLVQDPTTTYGHRSGSSNYYSGFNPLDYMNDTINGQTRGSTGTGYSTIVLQIKGLAANAVPNLTAGITGGATFTLVKELYGLGPTGEGMYWFEWTAPGGNLNYAIQMLSDYSSVGLDAFSVDTYWTSGSSPVTSAVSSAPEPTRAVLMLFAVGALVLRRRRAAAGCESGSHPAAELAAC